MKANVIMLVTVWFVEIAVLLQSSTVLKDIDFNCEMAEIIRRNQLIMFTIWLCVFLAIASSSEGKLHSSCLSLSLVTVAFELLLVVRYRDISIFVLVCIFLGKHPKNMQTRRPAANWPICLSSSEVAFGCLVKLMFLKKKCSYNHSRVTMIHNLYIIYNTSRHDWLTIRQQRHN